MRANLEITTIALVRGEFNSQHLLARDRVLVGPAQQLCGLTGEHASHDEFDAAPLAVFFNRQTLHASCRLTRRHSGFLLN